MTKRRSEVFLRFVIRDFVIRYSPKSFRFHIFHFFETAAITLNQPKTAVPMTEGLALRDLTFQSLEKFPPKVLTLAGSLLHYRDLR